MDLSAKYVADAGCRLMRGGAFKPRTSPYTFQGKGVEGLDMFSRAAKPYKLPIVTELMDVRQLDAFMEYDVDVIQIGTRNMQNFDLLKEVGRTTKPVILKRGMSATISEWLMAAEYIAAAEKLWGHWIQFYSYPNYLDALDKMGDTSALARCSLWFAAYKASPPTMPHGPWQKLGMWQSSGGTGPSAWHLPNGCPCDEDAILDEATFQSLIVQPAGIGPNPLAGVPVPGLVVPGENA